MLSKEQQAWVLEQFNRWGRHLGPYLMDTVINSSLFPRLISGGEPLPKPPPVINGKHCHALYDNPNEPVPLNAAPEEVPHSVAKLRYYLSIEGANAYRWVDKSKGLVEHANGDVFRVWRGEYTAKCEMSDCKFVEERWMMQLHSTTPVAEPPPPPARPAFILNQVRLAEAAFRQVNTPPARTITATRAFEEEMANANARENRPAPTAHWANIAFAAEPQPNPRDPDFGQGGG